MNRRWETQPWALHPQQIGRVYFLQEALIPWMDLETQVSMITTGVRSITLITVKPQDNQDQQEEWCRWVIEETQAPTQERLKTTSLTTQFPPTWLNQAGESPRTHYHLLIREILIRQVFFYPRSAKAWAVEVVLLTSLRAVMLRSLLQKINYPRSSRWNHQEVLASVAKLQPKVGMSQHLRRGEPLEEHWVCLWMRIMVLLQTLIQLAALLRLVGHLKQGTRVRESSHHFTFHQREMIAKTRKLPNMWRKQDFPPRSLQKNYHLRINLKGLEAELDLVQEAMFHQQPLLRDNHL